MNKDNEPADRNYDELRNPPNLEVMFTKAYCLKLTHFLYIWDDHLYGIGPPFLEPIGEDKMHCRPTAWSWCKMHLAVIMETASTHSGSKKMHSAELKPRPQLTAHHPKRKPSSELICIYDILYLIYIYIYIYILFPRHSWRWFSFSPGGIC